jgi:hypothetical protein
MQVLLSIFGSPHKKNTKISKEIFERKQKICIVVRRGCQSAHKIAKNWLRRFKNTKLKFDSILLIDESLVDKENSI